MLQVMVIDMLEGFARKGPLASPRVAALLPLQESLLRALPPGSLVVFVNDAHEPDDFEFQRFPAHCLKGSPEAAVCPELLHAVAEARAAVHHVEKRTFSGFFRTRLEEIVESAPSCDWVVIGCVTDCCVEANVAELVYRGRNVIVVAELVDTWDTSYEQVRAHGWSPAQVHDADRIQADWLERRLPAIWGVHVIQRVAELPGLVTNVDRPRRRRGRTAAEPMSDAATSD